MNRSPMTTPELIQWLRDNSSGVYRPARDAADLLARMTDREVALITELRAVRDYLDRLQTSGPMDTEYLSREMPERITCLSLFLHLDAFDVGDDVFAFRDNIHEYQGTITGKRTDTDGSALFTVEDQDGDSWDHSPEEIRLAD